MSPKNMAPKNSLPAPVRMMAALMLTALAGCGGDVPPAEKKARPFADIIAEHQCLSCHLPDNRMGVPSWAMVAAMYRDRKAEEVASHLKQKIVNGGSGAWGRMDMPPHPQLREPDLGVIVGGILASDDGQSAEAVKAAAAKKVSARKHKPKKRAAKKSDTASTVVPRAEENKPETPVQEVRQPEPQSDAPSQAVPPAVPQAVEPVPAGSEGQPIPAPNP